MSDPPDDPLEFLDSEAPHPSPILEAIRRTKQGLLPAEISIPVPVIPELPPQDFVEDVRQYCLSTARSLFEPAIIALQEEHKRARDAGNTIRQGVIEKRIDKCSNALMSVETDYRSDKFVQWVEKLWRAARKKTDGKTNQPTAHDNDDLPSAIPLDFPRDFIRFHEKLLVDNETDVKKEENRRRGGRRTKWDGLREEIRKANKETLKPHDDVIANRYNKRFSASISYGKRPRADARKVREVRYNMKRSSRT